MTTDNGGWTLVWSYTFTGYSPYISGTMSGAVTPMPSWTLSPNADVPVSNTAPLSETDYNATNFSLWRQIGSEFMVKSNINNWIACEPKTGIKNIQLLLACTHACVHRFLCCCVDYIFILHHRKSIQKGK